MTAVVELVDVRKTYAGPVDVLRGVNLSVQRGELVAIAGPSGSGKSTLLHIMGTLERPSSGKLSVDGYDTSVMDEAALCGLRSRRIGFVFQQFFLLASSTALDNVAMGCLYAGVAVSERRERAMQALEDVGLAHRRDHRPNEMSGGERQRVAIARALVGDPAVLFADEPTGNLDTATGAGVMELLTSLHARGRTIVVITHDRDLAAQMPRQISLRDGLVIADPGTPTPTRTPEPVE